MNADSTFTLDDIAALAELPRRTVRYYIQTGLVDRPQGISKGAFYTQRHVEQLLLIRKWQSAGLSLERIGELLRQQDSGPLPPTPRRAGSVEVWSHLVVADGIELTLEPGRADLTPRYIHDCRMRYVYRMRSRQWNVRPSQTGFECQRCWVTLQHRETRGMRE
jgi:DNA-binding transcriptional MerR regulator